ncbi:hypothetical protein ES705_44953 [subsurface metagenome]|nr:MAG: hypothetical protein ES695_19370 [Candidatus Atribacteria bacterium 1244-E10-H5-B2]
MKKILLEETKLGKSIAVGCELEGDEIGFYIAAADVSAICVFRFEEWENFVSAVDKANEKFKVLSR